ncbi:unnamed protein product, partial [Discosporangium mesarthrocarpum]
QVVVGCPWNLSPTGIILRSMEASPTALRHPVALQAVVLTPFLYMSLCCYRSLFTLRAFGDYALQGGHNSLPGPLLFNAQYLIRLQFALGYNFLLVLRYGMSAGPGAGGEAAPAFQSLMNDMTTVPVLGTTFNVYAPLVLVVLCLFTFFKGYARILRLMGLDHMDLATENDPGGMERKEEGRMLIERGQRRIRIATLR